MELLALIAGITACAFLVQSIRAKGTISQLKMELAARQNDLKLTEEESAALKRRLDQALIELDRFKDILDAEVEAARILDETKAERGQLLLLAKVESGSG